MQTGFDAVKREEDATDLQKRALLLIKLLVEQAIETSARFVSLCKRTVVTPIDMRMALIYEAHMFFKRENLETKFSHEVETFEFDDDDSVDDDDDEPYSIEFKGVDYDDRVFHAQVLGFTKHWSNWKPEDPIQLLLQASINRIDQE